MLVQMATVERHIEFRSQTKDALRVGHQAADGIRQHCFKKKEKLTGNTRGSATSNGFDDLGLSPTR